MIYSTETSANSSSHFHSELLSKFQNGGTVKYDSFFLLLIRRSAQPKLNKRTRRLFFLSRTIQMSGDYNLPSSTDLKLSQLTKFDRKDSHPYKFRFDMYFFEEEKNMTTDIT